MQNDSRLKGARILIVEDNALSVLLAEQTLQELGCIVAAKATTIASLLMKRNIPFIICSGYDIKLPGMNIPVVDKPYTSEMLGQALSKALAIAAPAPQEGRS